MAIEKTFAVAIRDGDELFLVHRIRCSSKGEIFHMPVTGREKDSQWRKWAPHESWHREGTLHRKAFDHKLTDAEQRQPPNTNFSGTAAVVEMQISARDASNRNVICDPVEFDEVFEIPADLLGAEVTARFTLDLAEAGISPSLPSPGLPLQGSNVIHLERIEGLVGASGFEPPASWSRTRRSTRLSHAPKNLIITLRFRRPRLIRSRSDCRECKSATAGPLPC